MGWNQGNFIATIGAIILGVGIAIYFAVMIYTYFKGEKAGRDPWDGRTLEWSIPNPPPEYNFAVTPTVHARDAFWYEKHHRSEIEQEKAEHAKEEAGHGGVHMPSQSWFPIITAAGMLFGGIAFGCKDAINATFERSFHLSADHNWGILLAIVGGMITFLGAYFWALEGPGGYHVHPESENADSSSHGAHH
jgi:cytochrome c oxidase subunit 1